MERIDRNGRKWTKVDGNGLNRPNRLKQIKCAPHGPIYHIDVA